jgi:hypothetical protein
MLFGFIGVGLGAILIAIAVLGFFNKKVKAYIPSFGIITKDVMLIAFLIVGLMAGGISWYQSSLSGVGMATATITGQGADELPTATLEKCLLENSYDLAGNWSYREDPNSNDVVYLDIQERTYDTNGQAISEIRLNLTCERSAEDVSEEQAIKVVADGARGIRSEVSTSDANEYYLLETSTRPSTVFDGDYAQTIYLEGDGNTATTSDTKEYDFIEFSEGAKTQRLSLLGEVDATTFSKLNNQTQEDIVIKTADGQEVYTVTVVKLAS